MPTRSSTSRIRWPAEVVGLEREAPADRGDPLGGVGGALARRDVGVDDREAADDRDLQVAGQPVGEVGGQRRAGRATRRTTIAVDRRAPVAEHLDAPPGPAAPAPGRPGVAGANSSRSAWP